MIKVTLDDVDMLCNLTPNGGVSYSKRDLVLVDMVASMPSVRTLKLAQYCNIYYLSEELHEWFMALNPSYQDVVGLSLRYKMDLATLCPLPEQFELEFTDANLAMLFKLTWAP